MKRAFFTFSVICIALLTSQKSKAQDSSYKKAIDSIPVNFQDSLNDLARGLDSLFHRKKSYLKVELSYLSNNVYFGRKDSLATPYLTPSLAYYNKSGLFVNASASYLLKSGQNRFDLFTVGAGYAHRFGDLDMLISASKFFYNHNSYNVESEIEGSVAAAFSYDWKIITPVVTGTALFGQQMDYAASFGLEHTFYAANDHLDITLSAMANASTQNYYNNYYKFRKYKLLLAILEKRGITEDIDAAIENARRFKLLDYELSVPINYSIKKFTFNLNPVFAIPINPASIKFSAKLPNQTISRTYKEKIKESFFFQAGIAYKF
ncbi:MAG TPA: hypothetical protein VKT28_12790 [Puia sp.]|nr:hypothetical protein [Puia sp.]